jgi:hypothetical protein
LSQKIIFDRQLADLGVKLFDFAVLILSFLNFFRENTCHAFDLLPFPRAHLR